MIELNNVHIGEAIKKRFDELEITKTEFGRRIGIPQQHVNRLFERDTMETKRLIKVCRALDFNFFALFCDFPPQINAYLSAVATGSAPASLNIGDAAIIVELEKIKVKLEGAESTERELRAQIAALQDNVATLKNNLADKDELIKVYKNK